MSTWMLSRIPRHLRSILHGGGLRSARARLLRRVITSLSPVWNEIDGRGFFHSILHYVVNKLLISSFAPAVSLHGEKRVRKSMACRAATLTTDTRVLWSRLSPVWNEIEECGLFHYNSKFISYNRLITTYILAMDFRGEKRVGKWRHFPSRNVATRPVLNIEYLNYKLQ